MDRMDGMFWDQRTRFFHPIHPIHPGPAMGPFPSKRPGIFRNEGFLTTSPAPAGPVVKHLR